MYWYGPNVQATKYIIILLKKKVKGVWVFNSKWHCSRIYKTCWTYYIFFNNLFWSSKFNFNCIWHCLHIHKTRWTCYVFFNNLFWSLKFNFRWFNPNWRPISFYLLDKGKIEKGWTKMKEKPNMIGVPKIS